MKISSLASVALQGLGVYGAVNGGSGCYTCMLIGSWIDQYTRGNGISYSDGLNQVCQLLPDILGTMCNIVKEKGGDYIIEGFEAGHTVDTLCHCTGGCRVDEGYQMCHLFPLPNRTPDCPMMPELSKLMSGVFEARGALTDWCSEHENVDFCQNLNNLLDDLVVIEDRLDRHVAALDDDIDGFSTTGPLRGYWWKGIDLNDDDSQVYPGRYPIGEDSRISHYLLDNISNRHNLRHSSTNHCSVPNLFSF